MSCACHRVANICVNMHPIAESSGERKFGRPYDLRKTDQGRCQVLLTWDTSIAQTWQCPVHGGAFICTYISNFVGTDTWDTRPALTNPLPSRPSPAPAPCLRNLERSSSRCHRLSRSAHQVPRIYTCFKNISSLKFCDPTCYLSRST